MAGTRKALAHFARHIVFGPADKFPACDRLHHTVHRTARRAQERRLFSGLHGAQATDHL